MKTNTPMLLLKPSVKIPSGSVVGQKIANMDDIVNAVTPPMRRTGAGLAPFQKCFGPVLAVNRVRKSDKDTFR